MERITYRITLDAHRNGIQRTLQGFETADNMARRIAVGLVSGGDTYELPLDHIVAMMYVTTPNATEPSINECVIEDNMIVYDALPIVEEGITEMQLKIIETNTEGAKSVLASPKFALEVTQSSADDSSVEKTTTFTALEEAVAKAKAVYDSRMIRFEITEDCRIRVYYADGTVYENDYFHDAIYTENALRSESFAKGGTGYREGEDTDNAMYYKNASEALFESNKELNADCREVLAEVSEKSVYTSFSVDFASGYLTYLSQNYSFTIDAEGRLQYEGQGEWVPADATKEALENLTAELMSTIDALNARVKVLEGI